MTEEEARLMRYWEAARLLPEGLRRAALGVDRAVQLVAEEFRLRMGQPMTVLGAAAEMPLPTEPVTVQDLQMVLDRATEFSTYRCADSIRCGYVTVRGGCRVGLCGTAVLRGGGIATLQEPSSLSVRIAKEIRGAAESVFPQLWEGGRFESTLLVAPPGAGKTTLLRDLIRQLSDGDREHRPLRLAVVDERGEIAAMHHGAPQFDVGCHTDVLSGTAKAEGILMLLRAMNPQVIAVDEITDPADIHALTLAANCGVAFLATVHGRDLQELRRRRVCRELLEAELFRCFVFLERHGAERVCRVERC